MSAVGHHLYKTARWKRLRKKQLKAHPLCVNAGKEGCGIAAVDVDHVKPHGGSSLAFFDRKNLQSLREDWSGEVEDVMTDARASAALAGIRERDAAAASVEEEIKSEVTAAVEEDHDETFEAAQATADEILDALSGTEAAALDNAASEAPESVKAYAPAVLSSGLRREQLKGWMLAHESAMSDDAHAEAEAWWASLSAAQRKAIKETLLISVARLRYAADTEGLQGPLDSNPLGALAGAGPFFRVRVSAPNLGGAVLRVRPPAPFL